MGSLIVLEIACYVTHAGTEAEVANCCMFCVLVYTQGVSLTSADG